MDNRKIIADYYACWVGNDRAGARALLADELVFRSPEHNFDSADAFLESCWKYAEHFSRFVPLQEAYDDNTAYVA